MLVLFLTTLMNSGGRSSGWRFSHLQAKCNVRGTTTTAPTFRKKNTTYFQFGALQINPYFTLSTQSLHRQKLHPSLCNEVIVDRAEPRGYAMVLLTHRQHWIRCWSECRSPGNCWSWFWEVVLFPSPPGPPFLHVRRHTHMRQCHTKLIREMALTDQLCHQSSRNRFFEQHREILWTECTQRIMQVSSGQQNYRNTGNPTYRWGVAVK